MELAGTLAGEVGEGEKVRGEVELALLAIFFIRTFAYEVELY